MALLCRLKCNLQIPKLYSKYDCKMSFNAVRIDSWMYHYNSLQELVYARLGSFTVTRVIVCFTQTINRNVLARLSRHITSTIGSKLDAALGSQRKNTIETRDELHISCVSVDLTYIMRIILPSLYYFFTRV